MRALIISLFFLAASASADAAEKVIYARTAVGMIHTINMAARTAMIGGYRYQFGSYATRDETKIKLYGYNTDASFEMLATGMKVRLRYADTGVDRYVLSLIELSPDADIHAPAMLIDP